MANRRQIREAVVQFLYGADLEGGPEPTAVREPFWDFITESDRRSLHVATFRTDGTYADGRHPDDETLARLEAKGVRIWRTDRQGTIHVDLAGAPARWPDPGYRIRATP